MHNQLSQYCLSKEKDLCKTPKKSSFHELKWKSISIGCFLLVRQSTSKITGDVYNLHAINLLAHVKDSQEFSKRHLAKHQRRLLFKHYFHFFSTLIIPFGALKPFLNLHCCVERTLTKKVYNWLQMNLSNTFDKFPNQLIGI